MTGKARRRAWGERIVLLVRRCFPRHWSPRKRARRGLRESLILRLWDWLPGSTRPDLRAELEATLHDLRHRSKAKESSSPSTSNASRAKSPSAASHASRAERWIVLDGVRTLLRAWASEIAGSAGFRTPDPGHRRSLDEPPASGDRFQGIVQDLRHSARVLSRAPAFTAVAVLTLGLGIGATTTFFTLVDGILLDPLPYADPDRLVKLKTADEAPQPGAYSYGESYPDLLELRRDNQVFSSLAAFVRKDSVLVANGEPIRVDARFAEPEIFELFGMPAALGRGLAPDDRDAIVLDHQAWRTHFGADPGVLGTTISLDQRPYVVVGVMPPGFLVDGVYPLEHLPVAWVPLASTPSTWAMSRRMHFYNTFARLAEGVTLEQAQQAMALASNAIHSESDDRYVVDLKIWVTPLHAEVVGDAGRTLWLLLGAVGFLLLITCANVANLQLTRLAARRRETAVRRALGAGRSRIARELLAENVLLGLLGGVAGLLLTHWGLRAFLAFSPGDLPRLARVDIDAGVLAFVASASLAVGVLFGLAPALRGSRATALTAMRGGGREQSGGVASRRLRNGLLVAELALAVVLLAGAGLVVNSFVSLRTSELGFDPSNVLTLRLDLGREYYEALGEKRGDVREELDAVNELQRRLYERLRAIPGIEAVAAADRLLPTWRGARGQDLFVESLGEETVPVLHHPISGDYVQALRIPLLAGRPLSADDWGSRGSDRTEVLLNEAAVQAIWPGVKPAEAIGRRVRTNPEHPWATVVGAIGDTRHSALEPLPRPEFFYPAGQILQRTYYFLVRARDDVEALVPDVRQAVGSLDPDMPVEEVRILDEVIDAGLARPRFYAFLFSIFGVLALVLAALGVAGVAAYAVAQRTAEIGVRMALGASPGAVLRLVLRQGVTIVSLGIGIGLAATWWLGRLVEGFLYGLTPTDLPTLAGVCAVLGLVGLVAVAIPARRAAAIDPVRALRGE